MIAGLIEPDSGAIVLAGESITERPVHRRNLGLVFQSYALFPHMSVFENVAFGLRRRLWRKPRSAAGWRRISSSSGSARTPSCVRQTTLPVKIFTAIEYGVDPTIAAVSTMLIIVTGLFLILAERWIGFHRFV